MYGGSVASYSYIWSEVVLRGTNGPENEMSAVRFHSAGGTAESYGGGSFARCFSACRRGGGRVRRRLGDARRRRRRARAAAATLRRRRRRAEVDRRRLGGGRPTDAARPRVARSRRPAVFGRLAVARCRSRRRRPSGGRRLAGEVVRLPVTMLAERAAVARAVTAAARLVRLATAVPTVLNRHIHHYRRDSFTRRLCKMQTKSRPIVFSKLSLLPSAGRKMNTGQSAVMLCDSGVKAGVASTL